MGGLAFIPPPTQTAVSSDVGGSGGSSHSGSGGTLMFGSKDGFHVLDPITGVVERFAVTETSESRLPASAFSDEYVKNEFAAQFSAYGSSSSRTPFGAVDSIVVSHRHRAVYVVSNSDHCIRRVQLPLQFFEAVPSFSPL